MGSFLVRRLLAVLPVILGVSVVIFLLIQLAPGDTATVLLGPQATEDAKKELRHVLGLDRSLPVQYVSWLGRTLGLWGGTILQWAVPLLLAAYFFVQRQTTAFAFSLFFFFENWLYTATYMADARAMVLPLVTTGDPDFAEHDWNTIFTRLGVLPYDTTIAGVVRFGGWCGMVGTIAWLVWRAIRARRLAKELSP